MHSPWFFDIRKKIFFAAAVLACVSFCAGYFSYRRIYLRRINLEKARLELERRERAWMCLRESVNSKVVGFKGIPGIVIKDLTTGWEIDVNEKKRFASASLVKIPIMAACFYANTQGALDFKQAVVLKNRYKTSGSGKLKTLPEGAVFKIEDLVEVMVAESDNTAANILIEKLDFDYLNSVFKMFGLRDTNINRKMMDFKKRRQGVENFTTASDVALLLEQMYEERLINKRLSWRCLEILKKQKVKDRIPAGLPEDAKVAHKTGLERFVCHDAGIVFAPGGDFLICVLTKHKYKTSRLAKRFISAIAREVYNYSANF